jgi:Fungal specific transcription factor domain
MPPRPSTLNMVNLYIENCLTIHPVFLEAEIFGSLDRVYETSNNASTALDHWTIRMILAIICAMQSKQRGDTLYSDAVGHICEALVVADQVLHPGSIKSIQAMLLLVQYSMLDPAHFDSWTLVGVVSRAMIDLGLHQDPSKSSNTPRSKLELRRRMFHCVYGFDRQV